MPIELNKPEKFSTRLSKADKDLFERVFDKISKHPQILDLTGYGRECERSEGALVIALARRGALALDSFQYPLPPLVGQKFPDLARSVRQKRRRGSS